MQGLVFLLFISRFSLSIGWKNVKHICRIILGLQVFDWHKQVKIYEVTKQLEIDLVPLLALPLHVSMNAHWVIFVVNGPDPNEFVDVNFVCLFALLLIVKGIFELQ